VVPDVSIFAKSTCGRAGTRIVSLMRSLDAQPECVLYRGYVRRDVCSGNPARREFGVVEVKRVLLKWIVAACVDASVLSAQEKASSSGGILERAQQLQATHQLQGANELLSDAVRRDPSNDAAWVELGRVQLQQRLNDDALKSFEAVLASHPDSAPAREGEVRAAIAAALADRQAGLNDSALLYLIRAKKLVPDSPELLMDFGIQAESMQIYQDADSALTRAHALDPNNLTTLYALARVQVDEQKMGEAEANLRAFLKARPDDASAHYGLGHLLHMLDRDDEAKAELGESIALQPRQSESYYELGQIALELHADDEARANYAKALAIAPNHGGALTGMGILAYRGKDYPLAEKYLQSAVFFASDYPAAHHFYALVLAKLGRQAESERELVLAKTLIEQQNRMSHGNFLSIIE
jgi:tetratricopeptide (TPR) repeat protein